MLTPTITELTAEDKTILRLLKITPEELQARKEGRDPINDQEPDNETLQLLGCCLDEYRDRREGIRRQRAENWQICERVLLKVNRTTKHAKEIQREAEFAFAEDKRAHAARKAAENREKFFNQFAQ